MKNLLTTIFASICLVAVVSCSSGKGEIPVVDIDAPNGSIDLKLSDLLVDIKMVPLETKDGLLLGSGTYKVSGKYIVYYDSKAIHLFDSNGKYLKQLAVAGGGPNEFSMISGMLLDEGRDVVYYVDFKNRDLIYRIDLLSGTHQEPLEVVLNDKSFSFAEVDNSSLKE